MTSSSHWNIWLILMIIGQVSAVSYNLPRFCPNASWQSNATTFAGAPQIGTNPRTVFVNTNNTVFIANPANNNIVVLSEGNLASVKNISGNITSPFSVFVTTSGDIYVDGGNSIGQVFKWTSNETSGVPVMYTCTKCYGLFVDIANTLYCSMYNSHQVVAKSLDTVSNVLTIVAGTGINGSTSNMLSGPYGIFVDINFDLYVADSVNDRIQYFQAGQLDGITVAGNTSIAQTISLNGPSGVILDADKYLYIADRFNNRIVASGPNGFRCIAGCLCLSGSQSNQFNGPLSLNFDSYGNIFVSDYANNRTQKLDLMANSCNEITTTKQTFTSTVANVQKTSTNMIGLNTVSTASNRIVSYNQPKLDVNTSWNVNATTFAKTITVGSQPLGIFINTNNMIYTTNRQTNTILIWANDSTSPSQISPGSLSNPSSLFVTINDEIYIDRGNITTYQVNKWIMGSNTSAPVMYVDGECFGIFVDINNILYCSVTNLHRVVTQSLSSNSNKTTIVAGTGCPDDTANSLQFPYGIFVDINLDLYVADSGNSRIQLFKAGQLDGITVAGSTSLTPTISLNNPKGVVLDADKYLFIVDTSNYRIIGSGPNGFRCIAACNGSGSSANQLVYPQSLAFDSYGNIFVTDKTITTVTTTTTTTTTTHIMLQIASSPIPTTNLAKTIIPTEKDETSSSVISTATYPTTTRSVYETTSSVTSSTHIVEQMTSTVELQKSISTTHMVNSTCLLPTITLIPGTSVLSSPLEFQRNQEFFISSIIEFNCNKSLSMITQWTIKNCTINCSQQIQVDKSIITIFSELYVPPQTLSYGIYELQLTVIINSPSRSISSASAYVKIIPSGITSNLVPLGTSMITKGYEQDLKLDPGTFSINRDGYIFNASDWDYEYYCRIYGLYEFPSLNGSLLSIDDQRIDPLNPSCLMNHTGNGSLLIYYTGVTLSPKSSLTIRAGSLESNRTYQFKVSMKNRQNSSDIATGSLLVQVENIHSEMIIIGCVIQPMCFPDIEFQRVNPTTQVALFALCIENCTTVQNITWNIYQGSVNSSSNVTEWIPFNQINAYENIWFFGGNTSNFTASNVLFLANPQIILWRFKVVYTFMSNIVSSALDFIINQPPSNGSCTISSFNGTTSTLFNISCSNWFDENGIKDYSLYIWTTDPSNAFLSAFSSISTFQVRLPAMNDQASLLYLIIQIRDTMDCVTKYNITSSVTVTPDLVEIIGLLNYSQNSSEEMPIIQLLSSGNQNIVGQIITSLSLQFNQMNYRAINQAISYGIPSASISVSSLGSTMSQTNLTSMNQSAVIEYKKQTNILANIRDYLVKYTVNLAILGSNSIKLQSAALVQFTQATNQLTRTTLMTVSDKCYQLTLALHSMATRLTYEDIQISAMQLSQCASNLLTAVNGPLQQRTNVLDLDFTRATSFPTDYDTDIEFEWSNLKLFADGNDFSWETIQIDRNIYYQKQLANQITDQTNKILSLLTSALNIHLNINQHFIVNSSEIFLLVEKRSLKSLSNFQINNAQIYMPSSVNLNITPNTPIILRSLLEPLASFGNSSFFHPTHINLSTSISFSILDHSANELSIQTNETSPIELIIPHDSNIFIPSMNLQDVTSINSTFHNQLFNLHYVNITNILPISIHFEIQPCDLNVSYLFIYKFDQSPLLNSSINQIDGWTPFCHSNLTNDRIYKYFLNNQQTSNHQSVIFGLRELNSTEINHVCFNSVNMNPPITNQRFNFTSNYQLRTYTSGCYYFDKNNQWNSNGLLVGPLTNHHETQCYSTHLTTFTGGFRILPEPVNWNYVFANADFLKNKTIYLTVICVSMMYIILIIYARYKDKKDLEKLGVTPLVDNHKLDGYFYQMIVFTGQRKDAGTKSNVHFVLSGDNDETQIRTLADPHRQILQRGGIDAFIIAVPKSLGLLNYIRIWHDNTGYGSSSSWFLKYIIIRDLQTMEKSYFICQRWFAVEKDNGKIERILSVADENEKREFSYILSKRAYHSVSDGHLWFSIFSRPPSNRFTRVQRCTCCFVLLFISMFLNIMYYDLSNEVKTTNSTSLSFGSLHISSEQIIIGIVVELFALVPSLFLVQLFRRIRSRGNQLSPLHQALYKMKTSPEIENDVNKQKLLPWWCIFIAYGLCIVLVGISVIFIISRGIEFGDLKTQKWLISILTGFFSSIFLTQPLKIIGLAIVFAYFCRNSNNDKEADEYLDDKQINLEKNEEYLHSIEENSLFTLRPTIRANRLNEVELASARDERLKEIRIWSIIREALTYLCFLFILCFITYSNHHPNSYYQVEHLRKYFLNPEQIDLDYTKIVTINDYWNWLENSFVEKIRAQQWYNGDPPRNLSGFINDKSNRFIGWTTMRQLRIKSDLCSGHYRILSTCQYDYNLFNEEKNSYQPGWNNETGKNYSFSIRQAFEYQTREKLDTYIYVGEHASYGGGGYMYEFRGRLNDLRSNLSELHQLGWIDSRTRAVIIQLNLYNPNAQLFTSGSFLLEILSTGGMYPNARFQPMDFNTFTSMNQLICMIIYLMMIIYFIWIEIQILKRLKWKYFHRFWSFIQIGIIICSWISMGIYIWRYKECQRIGQLFKETNGYTYINLQFASYVNDLLTILLGLCCFFGTIKFLRLCRYNRRLCLFVQTLKYATKELFSFVMMFSIVFLSFLCLFYFLFNSQLWSCSSLIETSTMLFQMTLMQFDASEFHGAATFLGPLSFSLFIFLVVFVCLSIFLSIINDNFKHARHNINDDHRDIYSYMFKRFQRWIGLIQSNDGEDSDNVTGLEYIDPIKHFPDKIDQLFHALNRIHMSQRVNNLVR